MSVFDLVDQELLHEIHQHLAAVSGLSIQITNADSTRRTPVANRSRFCRLMASTPEGLEHCRGGTWRVLPARAEGKISEFTCDAGLRHLETEVILDGEVLGNILIGQGLVDRMPDAGIRDLARRFGLPEDELIEAYQELSLTSRDKLREVMELARLSATALARYSQLGAEKQHLAQLKDVSESMFSALFDRLPDGAVITDMNGKIINCNQSCARLSGYSIEELRGMESVSLVVNQEEFYALNKRIGLGMPLDATIDYLRKNGSVSTIELTAWLGDQVSILTIFRDITDRLRLENKAHMQAALLDSVQDSVVGFDLDGKITYWGSGAQAMHGWTSEEVLGKNLFMIAASAHKGKSIAEKAVADGDMKSELEIRRKDGSTFIGEVHSSVVRDDDGRPIGIVGLCRDITAQREEADQRKRRIAELSRLYQDLLETERVKKRLVANISHELRTPLTTIGAYMDMFGSGGLGELTSAQKHGVDVVQRNVTRLDRLVTEMLDSVRMDAGRMVIQHRPVDLGVLLEQCIEYIAPLAKAAMLELEYHRSAGSVIVDGDESQLARVFTNLLTNAVKFNVSGGRIDVLLHDHSRGVAVVTVRDTGIGIPKDEHKKIFEQFYQVSEPGRRTYGGSGLGTTIAKQIVELHAGHIYVNSEPGKGSEFKVVLPTAQAVAELELEPSDEEVELMAQIGVGERARILIVEDDLELLDMLRVGFSNYGFETTGVATAAEGIKEVQTDPPEVVVLDLALPDTDGIEVCRVLRANTALADIPVLGITAWSDQKDLDEFAAAGADRIISKPFAFGHLLREVVQAVNRRKKT